MTQSLEAFTLRPVDLTRPNWAASTHKSRCTVFARDELSARRIARNQFRIAVARPMGQPVPMSPWLNDDDVDRKSGGEGKSVSARVDLGGRRIIKQKQTLQHK